MNKTIPEWVEMLLAAVVLLPFAVAILYMSVMVALLLANWWART